MAMDHHALAQRRMTALARRRGRLPMNVPADGSVPPAQSPPGEVSTAAMAVERRDGLVGATSQLVVTRGPLDGGGRAMATVKARRTRRPNGGPMMRVMAVMSGGRGGGEAASMVMNLRGRHRRGQGDQGQGAAGGECGPDDCSHDLFPLPTSRPLKRLAPAVASTPWARGQASPH
jgi:hypothetical protein